METDAQITSWPGYDGIVREAGYTNAPYPVTQNAEMTCITGGVHIRIRRLPLSGNISPVALRLPGLQTGDKAAAFIKENAQYPMRQVATDDIGFAIYQLDLSK